MIRDCKPTLEQRVARLENVIKHVHSARKFESDYSMPDLQTSCDWLKDELIDWFPDALIDVKMSANGKINIDYGPDDSDLYLEFQVMPERGMYSVSSSDGLISKAESIGDVFDMIIEAIQAAQAWA